MGVKFNVKGSFKNTEDFLKRMQKQTEFDSLELYAQQGVNALRSVTPRDTGNTANSWSYRITKSKGKVKIEWLNSNITSEGTPVVILLQYGHGTGTGGYVKGQDFINPAIKPIFDEIEENVWKEVQR